MSRVLPLTVFLSGLLTLPSIAHEGVIGTWKLLSYEVEVQANGQKAPVMEKSPPIT
jgi:hypothetical protein